MLKSIDCNIDLKIKIIIETNELHNAQIDNFLDNMALITKDGKLYLTPHINTIASEKQLLEAGYEIVK